MSQPDIRDKRYPVDAFVEELFGICKSLGVAVVTLTGIGKEKKQLAEDAAKLINTGNTGLKARVSRIPKPTEPSELYQIEIVTPVESQDTE